MIKWAVNGVELKCNQNSIEELYNKSKKCFRNINDCIRNKQDAQHEYLSFLKSQGITTFEIEARLTSPFITGLGSGHPTETGMILDRNTGLPYIPASSIKGVCLLSYAINLAKAGKVDAEGNVDDKLLEDLFGTQDENAEIKKRGQLVFLDAFTTEIPTLTVDIMNPHFVSYYAGDNPTDKRKDELKKQPLETELPVPIKFLTVQKGTKFIFRCYYLPLTGSENKDVSSDVETLFHTAFETVGFGGKTSIGYGRFKELNFLTVFR